MYCEPLRSREANRDLIQNFTVDREQPLINKLRAEGRDDVIGLELYLKKAAWDEDETRGTRVYLVKSYFSSEIVAYFALKAGMISYYDKMPEVSEMKEGISNGINAVTGVLPGIEISHFAVNDEYRRRHGRGGKQLTHLGEYLYPKFIYPIIERTAELVGVSHIYLYAAGDKSLIDYYHRTYGFVTNEGNQVVAVKPYYDGGCTFMFKDL